eukprot:2035554-Rhodomonas_salina.2
MPTTPGAVTSRLHTRCEMSGPQADIGSGARRKLFMQFATTSEDDCCSLPVSYRDAICLRTLSTVVPGPDM